MQNLRKSYAELKPLVEETGEYFQTISSNNFLPYENLQILKTSYDQMQEDFNEKIRSIDEILQNLTRDNEKWVRFNDELKRLETLFKDVNSLFESKTFADKSLEEKQQILEVEIDLYKSLIDFCF